MTKPIAFIAPYKKLADLFIEVANEMNKDVEVFIGDLQEGVKIAKDLEDKGYEVIISRGGTALAINDEINNLSVVEVTVDGFDLIRVLNKARQFTGRIAIAGFSQFTYGIEDLDYIMDIDVKVFTLGKGSYNNSDYIEELLLKIKKEGYNCLVGDSISVKIADKLGMDHYLIRSGKRSLSQALLEAERILKIKYEEIEKTKRNKSIIDTVHDGIISLDKNGIIQVFNIRAEEILGYKTNEVLGKHISNIIPQIDYEKAIINDSMSVDKLYKVNNTKLVINLIPIRIKDLSAGLVLTFQTVSNIQMKEKVIRKELYLKGFTADKTFDDIIGESIAIKNSIDEAKKYASVDMPLLIYGETGTGKELFAQAVHNYSEKSKEPFVAFNCAAVPEELLESELFGYVKGAFTGANKKGKTGLFEQAHGGTLFLDEIGEVSLNTQAKLLRVFEERKIRKVGDDKLTSVDVRLILATNKSLSNLVEKGRFREDLYYRINVLKLNIPPLRERKTDIHLLINYLIGKFQNKTNKFIRGISTKSINLLKKLSWPGNVRQLENTIEKLCVKTNNDFISIDLVKETIEDNDYKTDHKIFASNKILNKSLEEIEKEIIKKVLEEEGGNKSSTAKRLKIGRTTLWRKLNN